MVFCRRGHLNVQAVKPAVRCSENDRWLPQWPPARQWYLRWVNRSDSRKGLGCSSLPPPSTLKSHSQLCFKKSPTFFLPKCGQIFLEYNEIVGECGRWFFWAKEAAMSVCPFPPFFLPCQTAIWRLQELAAKLEAMNETAEKLSTLMETSEAEVLAVFVLWLWPHHPKIAKVDFLYDLSTCNVFFLQRKSVKVWSCCFCIQGFPKPRNGVALGPVRP